MVRLSINRARDVNVNNSIVTLQRTPRPSSFLDIYYLFVCGGVLFFFFCLLILFIIIIIVIIIAFFFFFVVFVFF